MSALATSTAILLIEDDPAWAGLTREAFLEVAPDVRLELITDGGHAVERLAEPGAPAIVLLDLNMPGTDGREVLKAVRELPGATERTIIVLSASMSLRDRALARDLGAAAYVNKPTTFAALCRLARSIVTGTLAGIGDEEQAAESQPADGTEGTEGAETELAPSILHLRVAVVLGHDASLAARLVGAGFDVRTLRSVEEVGPVAGSVDCIVLDLDAPGTRRAEALQAAVAAAPQVPVVAIGGAVTAAAELAALAAGAADVLHAEHASQEVLVKTLRFAVERTALTAALDEQRQFLDAVIGDVDAGIVACDASGRLHIVNAAAARLHGRGADRRLTPEDWAAAYSIVDIVTGEPLPADQVPLVRALAGETVTDIEVGVRDTTGRIRQCLVRGRPLHRASGELLGAVVVFQDVTDQRRAEAALARQALHDPLTSLPNRALGLDRLRHALDRGSRAGHATGVLFIDLDGFKLVNDTLGHAVGDRVLEVVGERLAAVVRPGDTAARHGGDEFLIVAEAVDDEEALAVADRVHAALDQPIVVGDREIDVTASIGVVVTRDETDVDAVLEQADAAMYRVKRASR